MRVRVLALFVTVGLSAGVIAVSGSPVGATAQSSVVSENPADYTPNVLDGRVNAVKQVGNAIVIGGDFTQIQAATGGPILARHNLAAFDATTGAISTTFTPNPSNVVTALEPSTDGTSIYVGGQFDTIAGISSPSLARLTAATGAPVAGFRRPSIRGRISDLQLSNGRLWIAGDFSTVSGVAQPIIATLNATTGAYDPFMNVKFSSPRSTPRVAGKLRVIKMAKAPNGSSLVVIGNFLAVNGQSRSQVAKLDTGGSSAALSPWTTNLYASTCSSTFDTYMRDVDYSPDGGYFVIATTGAYGGSTSGCDVVARFETGSSATGSTPTWTDYTGGDTTFTVEVTGAAVYTGGHFRWQNNAFAADQPGAGAVAREGIAALDPINGLPLNWNPGRAKGVGVFDMLATSTGLWVGSDTDRIGHFEHHAKIAYFPLAGGETIPAPVVGSLPAKVYRGGSSTGSPGLLYRSFDGSTAQSDVSVSTVIDWSQVRGAFMIGGTLYYGYSDGRLLQRSFNGSAYGPVQAVDTAEQLVPSGFDPKLVTGLYYANGQIYYTTSGNAGLYARAFTPSSRVVGSVRRVVSGNVAGIDFANVQGIFTAGGKLYWAERTDGSLRSIALNGDVPRANTATVLSGPAIDGKDWRGRGLFAGVGSAG